VVVPIVICGEGKMDERSITRARNDTYVIRNVRIVSDGMIIENIVKSPETKTLG